MLEVRNAKLAFGGVRAVDDVSLTVRKGSITGLIGTNGAGKTTLFNIISGFLRPDSGSIALEETDITRFPAHKIAAMKLLRTFQTPVGFPRMTVMENMLVFSQQDRRDRSRLFSSAGVSAEVLDQAMEILATFGLAGRRDVWVQDLSAPELKMLEFARTMMAEPRILLLDEPAAGVNPALMENLAGHIRAMRDRGVTFLMVDHNLRFVCDICDHIYAMADGRLIAEGDPQSVINDSKVLELYIGKSPEAHEI